MLGEKNNTTRSFNYRLRKKGKKGTGPFDKSAVTGQSGERREGCGGRDRKRQKKGGFGDCRKLKETQLGDREVCRVSRAWGDLISCRGHS